MRRGCPSVRLSVCAKLQKNAIFFQKLTNLEPWSLLTTYTKSYMGFSMIFSKINQFRAMVSIDNLYEVVHGLFNEPITGPLKSKMAEIRYLEN